METKTEEMEPGRIIREETEPVAFMKMARDWVFTMAANTDVPVTIRKKCLAIVGNLDDIEDWSRRQTLQKLRDAMAKKGGDAK